MPPAPAPDNESARLRELESYRILDTAAEPQYDAIMRLAAAICDTPIALLSLVDRERVWFKAGIGLRPDLSEMPRDAGFCAHAIAGDALFEVADANQDQRFQTCAWVTHDPSVRFYAGMPIVSPKGFRLGTLCVMDTQPRQLSPGQRDALRDLGALSMALLEARRLKQSFARLQLDQEHELELAVGTIGNMVDAECLRDPCLERVLIPAGRFSGDVIAVRRKPSGGICGMVADVTGHGLSSALYVIPTVQAFYKMCAKDLAPEVLCFELNAKIHQLARTGRFMAAVIFEIDPRAQTVSVWNGAMPAALYLDAAGQLIRKWTSRHPALGVLPDEELDAFFDTYRWTAAGQFLAFSDGLVDAAMGSDPTASVLRVADILQGTSVAERARRLVEIVESFRRRSPQHDDIAILAIDCERLARDLRNT
jgi:serine phosphatase RsbU (regulator of sigma subunit)